MKQIAQANDQNVRTTMDVVQSVVQNEATKQRGEEDA